VGALGSGWISDRFFGGRRAPVIGIMLVALAGLTALTERVVHTGSMVGTVLLFGLAGCMIYGPQVMLVGTLPQDFSDRRVVAGAAGFINAMGYLGAWVGDVATGRVAHVRGWGAVLAFWNATAIVAALLVALAVRIKPGRERPREAGA
jgi:OPA family glycerol-3-phosphate transporter-like MFS transporter